MAQRGPKEFHQFLVNLREGDIITAKEILAAVPAWKESTLDTYKKKHKLDAFISHIGDDRYCVVRDGILVTEADINAALSQVAPRQLTVVRGEVLTGENDTYQLTSQVGRGAVGTVWKAKAITAGRGVAVKICNPRPDLVEPSVLPNVLSRFRHESRFGPRVDHDAIIKYIDVGTHTKAPFLVMELAIESAKDRLERLGKLDLREVVLIGQSVVAALRHLESKGLVHRDVKPPNILRTDRGYVLGDLGILRWGDLNREFTGAGTITKAMVQLGSWNYMSPEQGANAHDVKISTDVYALGVTLIELLTGAIPPSAMVVAGRVPPPCSETTLNDLIARMTRYDTTERPSLDEIDRVLATIASRLASIVANP